MGGSRGFGGEREAGGGVAGLGLDRDGGRVGGRGVAFVGGFGAFDGLPLSPPRCARVALSPAGRGRRGVAAGHRSGPLAPLGRGRLGRRPSGERGRGGGGRSGLLPLARNRRDQRADLDRVGAGGDVEFADHPALVGFEFHRRLVGLDLGEDVAGFDGVALLDQPFGQRPLLHRRGHGGELDFGRHSYPSSRSRREARGARSAARVGVVFPRPRWFSGRPPSAAATPQVPSSLGRETGGRGRGSPPASRGREAASPLTRTSPPARR